MADLEARTSSKQATHEYLIARRVCVRWAVPNETGGRASTKRRGRHSYVLGFSPAWACGLIMAGPKKLPRKVEERLETELADWTDEPAVVADRLRLGFSGDTWVPS